MVDFRHGQVQDQVGVNIDVKLHYLAYSRVKHSAQTKWQTPAVGGIQLSVFADKNKLKMESAGRFNHRKPPDRLHKHSLAKWAQ